MFCPPKPLVRKAYLTCPILFFILSGKDSSFFENLFAATASVLLYLTCSSSFPVLMRQLMSNDPTGLICSLVPPNDRPLLRPSLQLNLPVVVIATPAGRRNRDSFSRSTDSM